MLLTTGIGALLATVMGTGTTALMLKSAWLRHWLYHGHLGAIATYRHEIYASANVNGYPLVLIAFPVIGLIVSAMSVACAMPAPPEPTPNDEASLPVLS
jgi:hypothetical protein